MTVQLPTPGGDVDTWGDALNAFLEVGLNPDGTLKQSAIVPAITAGPQGPAGPLGPTGPQGPPGTPGGAAIDVSQHGVSKDNADNTGPLGALLASAVASAQADGTNFVDLFFPPGVYRYTSPTTQGGATKGNAQIPLPVIPPNVQKVIIIMRGGGGGDTLPYWSQGSGQKAGVVFYSTAAGEYDPSFGAPSVLGGPTPEQGYGNSSDDTYLFNNVHVILDGIAVCSSTLDPTLVGFDLRGCAEMTVGGAGAFVDAPTGEVATTLPEHSWAAGLLPPNQGNNDIANVRSFSCEGFFQGIAVSEHCVYNSVRCVYCNVGLSVDAQNYAHGNWVGYLSAESCAYFLTWQSYTHAIIEVLDIEHNRGSAFDGGYDISDGGQNLARGYVGFQSTGGGDNEGVEPNVNGCADLKIVNIGRRPAVIDAAAGAPAAPASGTPMRNPFWRDALVSCAGAGITEYQLTHGSEGPTALGVEGSQTVAVPSGASLTLDYTGSVEMVWALL